MSSLANRARSAVNLPNINVTPLIDVLLVLLIIFMVIQPHDEAKLQVKAPEPATETPAPPPPPETLMLTVSSKLQLELNTKPVELDTLLPLLANLMEQRPADARTLFIKAPSTLAYGSVALLIDLAKGAGVITVGLVQGQV